MASLIFIATFITIIILFIKVAIQIIRHKSIVTTLSRIAIVILCYGLLWGIFYLKSTEIAVPFGTDVCFDDWCATITKVETSSAIGKQSPHGQFIILHIRISNHAKGIAQKPSEPKVHLIDAQGHAWTYSQEGQQALEDVFGIQIPIDGKLDLHQSLETKLAFDIPKEVKFVKVIIEEGPFITKLLLHDDIKVFLLQ